MGNQFYSERIVAFIDILGFKNLVEKSLYSETNALKLHRALQRILTVKSENEDLQSLFSRKKEGVEVSTFSDSAVISYPINYEGGLFYILLDLIHLQLELICNGILVRGGITIGRLYHDGDIVYGPAMNEAYRLESKIANVPRIIIKKDILLYGIEKTVSSQNGIEYEMEYVFKLVKEDCDGMLFLDILRQEDELSDFGDEYFRWLQMMRSIIIEGLNENVNNERVYSKYEWLMQYFNSVVMDLNEYFPVPEVESPFQLEFRKQYLQLGITKEDFY